MQEVSYSCLPAATEATHPAWLAPREDGTLNIVRGYDEWDQGGDDAGGDQAQQQEERSAGAAPQLTTSLSARAVVVVIGRVAVFRRTRWR
ncbi:hypothetical protein SCNU_06240 [Gordonia neofelifaecis NRRL B-59395]|uniref:Uncharacterized protein n=1 Tax=Gordonia neofelifaecis NRRL B-59395 TaxID=644548 RepID=F1YHI0_9ACTN|nr:hypothetical protein SCNU_06240 [Gordonia neofelifaecis NRRL B-59395]